MRLSTIRQFSLALTVFLGILFSPQINISSASATATNGFCDNFDDSSLNGGWQWVDPLGDSSYSLTDNPGHLRISTSNGGHDLYANTNAPRLLQPVHGDFTVVTKVTISPAFNYQGAGLLIWQDENNYVRLERTLVSGIDFLYKMGGTNYSDEISFSTSDTVYLKLQRAGNDFSAWYSMDNLTWEFVQTINFPNINHQLQTGPVLINQWQDNPIYADFDFFHFDSCSNDEHKIFLPITFRNYTPPVSVPILAMAFYPPSSSNPAYLDETETGLSNYLITDMRAYVQQMVDEGTAFVSDATRYHGYKDSSAPVYLQYRMHSKIEYNYAIPRGYPLSLSSYLWDLGSILRNVNICNYVDSLGIKEVWIYGYETNVMHPSESKMSSRYGDISNSYTDEGLPTIYRLPRCTNSYVVYSFNYGRELATNIENRMHQIERVMGYIDYEMFWQDFSEDAFFEQTHDYLSSCGNAHYAPNWLDPITSGYVYNLTNYALSNCETWHPDDSQTTYISLNCTQWGCTNLGFFKWFMQNMPGKDNGIIYQGKKMRNWWEAMYDFNAYVDMGRGFFEP